jgi:hypothetical protein
MLFYLQLLLLIGFFLYLYSRYRHKGYRYMVTFIIIFVAIFRYQVGYDYITYYDMIYDANSELVNILFAPLSAAFAHIAIYFKSPQLIFILFGIPIYILLFSTFKKYSSNYALSIITYMAFGFYGSLSVIRQALAIAICVYGFRIVVDRQFIKYLFCIILACLFHPSAFVSIIIYFMYRMRFLHIISCIICAVILKHFIFNILITHGIYDNYLTDNHGLEGGAITRVIQLLIIISCLITWFITKKEKEHSKINNCLIYILLTGIAANFMFDSHIGGRIAGYFSIYLCLLVPNITSQCTGTLRRQLTICYYTTFIGYYFAYLCMPMIKNVSSSYIPYKFVFLQ